MLTPLTSSQWTGNNPCSRSDSSSNRAHPLPACPRTAAGGPPDAPRSCVPASLLTCVRAVRMGRAWAACLKRKAWNSIERGPTCWAWGKGSRGRARCHACARACAPEAWVEDVGVHPALPHIYGLDAAHVLDQLILWGKHVRPGEPRGWAAQATP